MKLTEYIIFAFLTTVMYSCSGESITKSKKNKDLHVEEIVEIIELVEHENYWGCLLDLNGNYTGHITPVTQFKRVVNGDYLDSDTLFYLIEKDGCYAPLPIEEGKVDFRIKMKISDIDTDQLDFSIKDDVLRIHIYLKEGTNLKVAKFGWRNNQMEQMWEIDSDSIKIDFPNDVNKMKKSFSSYRMFHVDAECQMNYINENIDQINDTLMAQRIIEEINNLCHK